MTIPIGQADPSLGQDALRYSSSMPIANPPINRVAALPRIRSTEGAMDGFDVLGERPERRIAFTGELLAETQDAELQRIVESAAADLTAPMALVTLVLDQIQYFKAHYGLPADLAAARGTHRDVSFCQLVVRDEQKLEVTDAPNDTRVPQHVVAEYDINAYLGVPIHVGDVVVGSLCVLDTKPREFTDEEHATLERLAESVDERVLALSERRRSVRAELTAEAVGPALTELRESVEPVRSGTEAGIPAMAAIRSYLALSEFVLAGGSARPAAVRLSLEAAKAAVEEIDDVLYNIQASADDCDDCVVALEHLLTPARSTQLSEVLRASQDLARHSTRPVGNVPLPDGAYDPVIYTPRPLAVAFLTSLLVNTADRLANRDASEGIRLEVGDLGESAELAISADSLTDAAAAEIAAEMQAQLGEDPSISIRSSGGTVRVALAVVPFGATED